MEAWAAWALASALFAALTAIFAKIGLKGINSHFATFIRTIIIALCLAAFLRYAKAWQPLSSLSPRNWAFLILSGLATGCIVAGIFQSPTNRQSLSSSTDR